MVNFEKRCPNWALGLGKFEPHDFRGKNTRTNQINKKKINFLPKKSHRITYQPTLKPELIKIMQKNVYTCKYKSGV